MALPTLNVGVRWKGMVNFTPHRFTPREGFCSTHCTESLVNPRVGLDASEKTKISYHRREWNPNSSVDQLAAWSLRTTR